MTEGKDTTPEYGEEEHEAVAGLTITPLLWLVIQASLEAWLRRLMLDLKNKTPEEQAQMKAELEAETAALDLRLAQH